MICLYNGNYEEHDWSEFYACPQSADKNLERMERQYATYPGTVVGDFTCIKVEYDWGKRQQRWTIKCNKCGAETHKYNVKDWRRGTGSSTKCKHCANIEKENRNPTAKEKEENFQKIKKDFIGKIYGDFEITNINKNNNCKIKCKICGKTKGGSAKVSLDDLINNRVNQCDHKIPNDYSDPKWIGKRNGHLTAIGKDGGLFIVKCDCGQQTTARGVDLFTRKAKKSCGLVGCTCSTNEHIASVARRKRGFDFELETEAELKAKSYNASTTKPNGDYGVDIIITEENGELIAVQCKNQTDLAGIESVQEVYAGGRFYDCTKFAVICKSGFTSNAIIMARKLGVYLCDDEFNMPSDISTYAKTLLPVYHDRGNGETLYEINGEKKTLADWCGIYNHTQSFIRKKLKEGISLSVALQMEERKKVIYKIGDLTGTLQEICDYFGVIPGTVSYRMNTMGMSLEEAILTPTKKTVS